VKGGDLDSKKYKSLNKSNNKKGGEKKCIIPRWW
jgi:hypothetical protein